MHVQIRALTSRGLVCAAWPGASWSGPLPEDFFLTGDQLRREPRGRQRSHRLYVVLGDPAVHLPTLWQSQTSELSTAPMPADLVHHIALSAWQGTAPDVQDLLRQLSGNGLAKLLANIEPLRDDS